MTASSSRPEAGGGSGDGMPGIPDALPLTVTTSMSCPWPGWPRPPWGLAAGHVAGEPARRRVHRPAPAPARAACPRRRRARSGWPLVPDPLGRGSLRAGAGGDRRPAGAGRERDRQSPDDWAGQVRPAVSFAMGMITELEESGADLGPLHRVRLDDPDAATPGVPSAITSGRAGAPGRRADTGTPSIAGAGARTACPRCRCPGIPPATPASAGRDCRPQASSPGAHAAWAAGGPVRTQGPAVPGLRFPAPD